MQEESLSRQIVISKTHIDPKNDRLHAVCLGNKPRIYDALGKKLEGTVHVLSPSEAAAKNQSETIERQIRDEYIKLLHEIQPPIIIAKTSDAFLIAPHLNSLDAWGTVFLGAPRKEKFHAETNRIASSEEILQGIDEIAGMTAKRVLLIIGSDLVYTDRIPSNGRVTVQRLNKYPYPKAKTVDLIAYEIRQWEKQNNKYEF